MESLGLSKWSLLVVENIPKLLYGKSDNFIISLQVYITLQIPKFSFKSVYSRITTSPDSPQMPLTSTNLAFFRGPTSMLPGTSTTICCLSTINKFLLSGSQSKVRELFSLMSMTWPTRQTGLPYFGKLVSR